MYPVFKQLCNNIMKVLFRLLNECFAYLVLTPYMDYCSFDLPSDFRASLLWMLPSLFFRMPEFQTVIKRILK